MHTNVHQNKHKCTKNPNKCTPKYIEMYKNIHTYIHQSEHKYIPQIHTKVHHKCTQNYIIVNKNEHKCTSKGT